MRIVRQATLSGCHLLANTSLMTFFQMIKMNLWSFLGIRKRSGLESDLKSVHPVQVIAMALVMVTLFIGILLLLVNIAVH